MPHHEISKYMYINGDILHNLRSHYMHLRQWLL